MARKWIPLDACLFDAFANTSYCNPQDKRSMWAIIKELQRLDLYFDRWKPTNSRKEHRCVRGCLIEEGHIYFRHETGPGWGDNLKVCASCTAMILYFKGVPDLHPRAYSYWDIETESPVRDLNLQAVQRLLEKIETDDGATR